MASRGPHEPDGRFAAAGYQGQDTVRTRRRRFAPADDQKHASTAKWCPIPRSAILRSPTMKGLAEFLLIVLALLPLQPFVEQPSSAFASVWLGFAGWIIQTIVAFGAYLFGLGRLPAGIASILAMSEIAFVSLYAYFWLGERLGPIQIFGVALVVGGVLLLVQRQKMSRETEMGMGDP